ncbi:hypothetical protein ALP20_200114 [Pseudomonas coronafaciens pv. coronafaciens]|nr:hypothetical protein ALP20_200114 [Pseudomonas coronafaciens pv. coronafaciens]
MHIAQRLSVPFYHGCSHRSIFLVGSEICFVRVTLDLATGLAAEQAITKPSGFDLQSIFEKGQLVYTHVLVLSLIQQLLNAYQCHLELLVWLVIQTE